MVVANGPSAEQELALAGVTTAEPDPAGVTTGGRPNERPPRVCGGDELRIRRAAAPVVVLFDTSAEPRDDLLTPLVAALADPGVAVAGPFGLVTDDLRSYEEPPAGTIDVVAIEGYAQAFRRADYVARGPLDEHFGFYRNLDIWWSLVLRDPFAVDDDDADDEDADDAAVADFVVDPASCRGHAGRSGSRGRTSSATSIAAGPRAEGERDRLSKRNFYRISSSTRRGETCSRRRRRTQR